MTHSTLLAHLSDRFGHGSENLATESLEYVLRHPQVADAFHSHLRGFAPSLPVLNRFRTQVGDEGDRGIRDLVGSTADHHTVLVVEVKFDAPLTSNQPGSYLRALAKLELPTLLMFLVPTYRAIPLWPRLLRRCQEADIELSPDPEPERMIATHDSVTLAITTWAALLDDLRGTPRNEANRQVLGEVDQIRGLCARADQEGFIPFGTAFLEGDTGRYLLALDGLLNDAVEMLHGEHLANTSAGRWSSGQGYFGRYFWLAGLQSYLHASFPRWGTLADTPLWLRIWPGADPRVSDALELLRTSQPRRLFDEDGQVQIPILLPPDGDREACLASIVTALKEVHGLLVHLQVPADLVNLPLDELPDEAE